MTETEEFGPYRLLSPLGYGPTDFTFLALDSSHAPCLIKRQEPDQPSQRSRILHEGRVIGTFDHPNVVALRDMGIIAGRPFLAMDYGHGVALSELLEILKARSERMPARVAVEASIQLLRGLHAVHEAKDPRGRPWTLFHGGLTPLNILMTSSGAVKLMEFGPLVDDGAAPDDSESAEMSYMPPERSKGVADDRRSDLFSVGAMTYEMLTSIHPFTGEQGPRTRAAINAGPTPGAPSLTGWAPVDLVLRKALAPHPARRYPTASAMSDALRAALPRLPAASVTLSEIIQAHFGERFDRLDRLIGSARRSPGASRAPGMERSESRAPAPDARPLEDDPVDEEREGRRGAARFPLYAAAYLILVALMVAAGFFVAAVIVRLGPG
ncbi:MAG: serine/threonine-protein kinase [Myxococcota bacterium]